MIVPKNYAKSWWHVWKLKIFTQGLRPFSSAIPKTLKKYLKKSGYNYSNIVDNWTKMVTKKISDSSYPITVKMGKEMKDGTLVLNVLHGKEMEIEYKKKEIIDKINCLISGSIDLKLGLKNKVNSFNSSLDISKISYPIEQNELSNFFIIIRFRHSKCF